MRVKTYAVDGTLGAEAELQLDEQMQLWLDDTPILAVSLWGAKVALTLTHRLVLIAADDYGQITKYGSLIARANNTS